MDIDVYINGVLRADLRVLRIMQSYVQPWSCELAYDDRHDHYPVDQYSWVIVRRADTGLALFRGNIMQISPGGVAAEGIALLAQGRRFRLENEPVNINGSGVYIWNRRGHQCNTESGEDSPGRDGGKWTAGEIIIDILEHALGIPEGGSAIPGHHSSAGCVTETYLTAQDILTYMAPALLALDSVVGEFSVDNTPVAQAIQELVALNGGFYGWYIDATGVLVLRDLKALPEIDIEAGELGHWQDEGGKDYELLDNKLDWSLDGVYSSVMVQGTDRTVEVKPENLDGCANAALNGGGELELVNAPWKGYPCAYRALDQPYRKWTSRSVGFEGSCEDWRHICECGMPAGMMSIVHAPRIYRGTDAGAKSYFKRPGGGYNWRVNKRTGIAMFYWDVSTALDPGEKLWGWYWAPMPFTVTAGPEGSAYDCLGYERTLKINDPAFKHTTSYPRPGTADDEVAMGLLAERMLEQFKDIRIQGHLQCDAVDPVTYNLDARYNVTRLERPTTTSEAPTTTTAACWPNPLDWGRLALNAVEVTHDFVENLTEILLANTFFMLEGYSALRERLKLTLFAERELDLSEDILECQIDTPDDCPEDHATFTEWPSTTSTAAPTTTTTTPGGCNACDPPIPDTLHVTLCALYGDFEPYEGDHTLTYTSYCLWRVVYSAGLVHPVVISLEYDAGNTRWIVTLNKMRGTSCRKRWHKADAGGCTPEGGAYTALDCLDDTCWDDSSCIGSSVGTCEVSVGGSTCPPTGSTTTAWCEDCRDLEDICYLAHFAGCCHELNYTCMVGGTPWATGGGMIGGMLWAGAGHSPIGPICTWTGELLDWGDCPTTTTACPAGFVGLGSKVDLIYHPYGGWYILNVEAIWRKDEGRFNQCDPCGSYTCIIGGCGTAFVEPWWCHPPTTTTTAAPGTTTTAAPGSTTTAAPAATTTTAAAPTGCGDLGTCATCNNVHFSGDGCLSSADRTLTRANCVWTNALWGDRLDCDAAPEPDRWNLRIGLGGGEECHYWMALSTCPYGNFTLYNDDCVGDCTDPITVDSV